MDNGILNKRLLWGGFLLLTLFVAIKIYLVYEKEMNLLFHSSQVIFDEAIQRDMDRRSKELGDDFRFYYSPAFEKDTISLQRNDTMLYIENDNSVAQKMSNKEKIDFGIQLFLSNENPIQVTVLDSLYRNFLWQQQIPAETAVAYTIHNKPVYSRPDSSFYQTAKALDEIAYGPTCLIVLQAFVKIPPCYIVKKAVMASGVFIGVWILAFIAVLWLTFSKRGQGIHLVPVREAPKTMLEILPGLLLDETHGILQSGDRKVELINFRLKLFLQLLEHKGYFIETDKLLETVWPDGSVSKDALSSTVKRLKEDLSLFPEITIESGRGKGYMLNIVDGPEASPDSI